MKQIVIEISDQVYNYIKDNGHVPPHVNIAPEIANGTVLPEGHGRLIDADDLIQDILDDNQLCIFNSESERVIHDAMVNFAVDRLSDCSTIIEADKSEVD